MSEVNLDSFSNNISEIINKKYISLKYYETNPIIFEIFLGKYVE